MPPKSAVDATAAREAYHHGDLRNALLDAGLDLTRHGGPDAVTVREVARRAGVVPTAVYRHFADREALVGAIALRVQQQVADRMRETTSPDEGSARPAGSARGRLRAVGLGYIGFALAEPGWFELAFGGARALPDAVDPAALPAPLAMLVRALDDLVVEGALPAESRPGAEWPCWSTVHGFALLALRGPLRALSRDALWAEAERAVDTVIDGLLMPAV
ncbi:TetR/AcrR family transcriptional regulator [Microbacterium sp. zg.Y909]|uniref:TetR/AcrR family transcriptional regulator n=1 Tax=Microbacterium sp. zg.Y909 TaxID=2969413 RepID=UPI00214C5C43|nr:TetR/AcrR family transcriptional regulator [Microbacterium sp. zg.Y909]MCR2824757.1 TetR/AcrR family transcriptional regulator [Microbacterium sp. zg.Y909]